MLSTDMDLLSRRALISAPFFIKNLISAPANGRVRLGAMGASNMAWHTLKSLAAHSSVDLVSVAEIDTSRTTEVKDKYPAAKHYQDWRKMLDAEYKNLDAICVGTPDHMHAPQAMAAMQRGLHVYCQKPLTSKVAEARKLNEFAAAKNLVTQMGIQVHSSVEYKTAVAMIQSGAIGKIKEVHTWSNKKWGDMDKRPKTKDAVPRTLDWNGWLGVARPFPYIKDYCHLVNWRKRLEFGTGTFGDMGCHIYDPVFAALALTSPLTVRAEGPAPNKTNWAINAIVKYVFPGTKFTAANTVNVTWYDGDERPPREIQDLIGDTKMPDQGSITIGTDGVMLLPHVGKPIFFSQAKVQTITMPDIQADNHYFQFVDSVMGKGKTSTSFDYSGPLSETVLLGSLATKFPKTTLEWDSAKLSFKNMKAANQHLRRKYRSGWKVQGLA